MLLESRMEIPGCMFSNVVENALASLETLNTTQVSDSTRKSLMAREIRSNAGFQYLPCLSTLAVVNNAERDTWQIVPSLMLCFF